MNKESLIILCSNCFSDQGLRETAKKYGVQDNNYCTNCKLLDGYKLTKAQISEIAYEFFVNGSVRRAHYGSSYTIQMNEHQYGNKGINFPSWLIKDAHLIQDTLKEGLFYYGPRMWRVGEIEPLKLLQNRGRKNIIKRILKEFPSYELLPEETFYRLRKNPIQNYDIAEFDSPPVSNGRLNAKGIPILYGSKDLHVCIHECRATIADELYVATLKTLKPLKLLNLAAEISEDCTEFESLNLSISMLFRAENHSYKILQSLSKNVFESQYDGLLYPSYFSQIHKNSIVNQTPNIAIFGKPIQQGLLSFSSINRVILETAEYTTRFGPVVIY